MTDHLEEAADAASTVAALGKHRPKKISIVHYGPGGAATATRGSASYSSGKQLNYDSTLPGGVPHGQSQVALNESGQVASAESTLLDATGAATKHVTADYSSLELNKAGSAASGSVGLVAMDTERRKLHTAEMTYANEAFSTYAMNDFTKSGAEQAVTEAVQSHVHVDYSEAKLVANRIVGGMLQIAHLGPDGTLKTHTESSLNHRGVPTTVRAINFESDGTTPKTHVVSDYAGVLFSPRRQVHSGKLVIETQTPEGETKSKWVFSYSHGKIIGRRPFERGEVIAAIHDKVAAVPGPWQSHTAPDKVEEIHRADGTLLQRQRSWLTGTGKTRVPRRSVTDGYALDGSTIIRVTDVNYTGATFEDDTTPTGGTVVSTHYVAGTRASATHVHYS